ncbi:hypothetical protein GCM10027290_64070 [Micromonospora sonneratiae]|uniref:Uncharacterized protein n=1 Tax=Micromonospora sonneratiae TaxID=1184706 RepID=A0ABW3YRD0_9ACTN
MSDAHTFERPQNADPAAVDVTQQPADPTVEADELVAWSEEPPEERKSRPVSRRRRILLGTALLVGLIGAAGIGTAGWRVASQKDASLDIPPQVAGLVLDNSEHARGTADYLRNGFIADIEVDQSIGAVYTDPNDPDRTVLLFGGTTLLWRPERDLDSLFELLTDDAGAVTGLHKVPEGKLGGVMKCGTTATEDGNLTVCGWADHGSVALAMFAGRDVDQSAELLRKIRESIQIRH